MSDLAAAAVALGLPEALVERSVRARAAETGQTVDDLLAQWAGGETAPTAPAPDKPAEPAEPAGAETESETAAEPEAPTIPEIVIEAPRETPAAPEPSYGPYRPPVLVGARDNPMTVLTGVIGLFVIVVMVGLVGPSIPTENPGARSSAMPFSAAALDGQNVYSTSGCVSCHTQTVRPVVADVGLGAVTLNDTNQVVGTRRFGPDLSNVGSRIPGAQIEAIIAGLDDHPAHSLGPQDLAALVAYLSESRTLEGSS